MYKNYIINMNSKVGVLMLLAFIFVFTHYGFSQNNGSGRSPGARELDQDLVKYKNLTYKKMLSYASILEHDGSYVNAVEYYKMANAKKPTNKCVLQKLSELNFILRDYETAELYTTKLLDLDKNYDKNAELRLALCMKANGKYKEAIEQLEYIAAQKKSSVSNKVVENEISGAKLGLEIRNVTDDRITVEDAAQINGYLTEYAPQPLKDGNLIYSSLISDTALNYTKLKYEGADYTSKLLFTKYDEAKKLFSRPELLPKAINVPEIHIGNGVITPDGKHIYYTQCVEGSKMEMKCKVWLATKGDDKWTTTELKKLNSKGTTNTQPSYYDDGSGTKYLLFVSDRNGGKGGLDIWYSAISADGTVGDPTNLAAINTFGNEITPYYNTKTKTLYFSSNGYPSIGGYDVFKVDGDLKKWDKVINLKHPINSSVDDIYLKYDDGGEEGYMVTNRVGSKSPRGYTCCDDIWSIRKTDYSIYLMANYASSSDELRKPLAGVDALMIDNNEQMVLKTITNDSTFLVKLEKGKEYKINGIKDGYYPGIETFTTPKKLFKTDTIYKVFLLDPIDKKRFVVQNVYYAFDKSVVREEYYPILDSVYSLMNLFPNYFLKIDGFTDSRGTVYYNQALSERRCKSAAEYLLLKGLSPQRMIMRGYGETVPIAPNVTPSGEDDPAGRAKNRRVEFKLLEPNGRDPKLDIEYRVNTPFSND